MCAHKHVVTKLGNRGTPGQAGLLAGFYVLLVLADQTKMWACSQIVARLPP